MAARNTTVRDRDRAYLRRHRPPCGICGQPIDYALPWTDPGSFTVDHVVPLARGGTDTRDNKQAAHRACNRAKSDRMPDDAAPRQFVTQRDWVGG